MSRDTLVTDGEGQTYSLDNYGTQKWLDGHYSGLDQCCEYLEQKATRLFAQRQRDKAVELQNLADELKKELRPLMVTRAKEHERDFPATLPGKAEKKASLK